MSAASITTKRSSPRRSRRSRTTKRTPPRNLALYSGTTLLGIIKVAGDGRATAFSADGRRIGIFPSFEAATAAFNKTEEGA